MNKLFKKSAIITAIVLVFVVVSTTAFAAGRWVQAYQDDTLKIKFNGVVQSFTDPEDGSKIVPLIFNERTYLPVRAIATLAGLGVDYDEATHSVLLTAKTSPVVEEQPEEPAPKPRKDSEAFNSGVKKTYEDALEIKPNANIKPGEYENASSGTQTRRLIKDDFKALTEYGFDVYERLADSNGEFADQFCAVTVSYKSYKDFTQEDQERIAAGLYKNIVDSAKASGWAVKKEGRTSADSLGKSYPKVYIYKDGVYVNIKSFIDSIYISATTYDVGMN